LHNHNILCIIKVLLWILASEKHRDISLVTNVRIGVRTSRADIQLRFLSQSCAQNRISERLSLLFPFALLASSAFPVTCVRFSTSVYRRTPNARKHHSCRCVYNWWNSWLFFFLNGVQISRLFISVDSPNSAHKPVPLFLPARYQVKSPFLLFRGFHLSFSILEIKFHNRYPALLC